MKWRQVRGADAAELWAEGALAVESCGDDFLGHFYGDEDAPEWAVCWMRERSAVRVSERLAVAPSWAKASAEIVLRIDPGLAFGDGAHPTTQLCLRELEKALRPGDRVLDVGTGTGILGIAALKLGAASALGTDIDEVALRTAARLARLHDVPLQLARSARGRFDLVLANLPLEAQAGLAAHVAPGGTLIASGFLASVAAERLYPSLRVESRAEQSGWGLTRMSGT